MIPEMHSGCAGTVKSPKNPLFLSTFRQRFRRNVLRLPRTPESPMRREAVIAGTPALELVPLRVPGLSLSQALIPLFVVVRIRDDLVLLLPSQLSSKVVSIALNDFRKEIEARPKLRIILSDAQKAFRRTAMPQLFTILQFHARKPVYVPIKPPTSKRHKVLVI
jgi:hypothetical protein